jgi:hypothetical protein
MKTLIQSLTVALLLVIELRANGQCRISVEAPDSLPFILTLNETAINQVPVLAITLDQNLSGKVNFKAGFPMRPELNFSQVITIKKGTFQSYNIERSKGTLKFVLTGESEIALPEFVTDSKSGESSNQPSADQHTGCFPVADDLLYQSMLDDVAAQHFESKKLSILSDFASSQCIRMEQLRAMMSVLTQEDNKISLLAAAKNHIYDPEQIRDVLNEFFLARNKQKAVEIIEADR